MKYHDQHVHTNFSGDSTEVMENYLIAARKLGLKYFAVTDHCDFMASWVQRDEIVNYDEYNEYISKLQKKYPDVKILIGCEMGYQQNKIDEINQYLKNDFDVVILSVHEVNDSDFFYKSLYEHLGINETLKYYFDTLLEATTSITGYDILGHIDYCLRSIYRHFELIIELDPFKEVITKIFQKIIELGKSLEINTSVYETVKSFYYIDYFVSLYLKLGGRDIAMTSDCHAAGRFLSSFPEVSERLAELGVKHLVYYVKHKKHYYNIKEKNV